MENMNWKETVAQSIREVEPQALPQDKDTELAHRLQVSLNECKFSGRNLEFAQSLLDGFVRWGSFTDAQRPHVERLLNPPPEVAQDKETAAVLQEMVLGYLLLGSDREFAESLLRSYTMHGQFSERQRPYAERLIASVKRRLELSLNVVEKAPEEPVATTSAEAAPLPRVEAPSVPAAPFFPCKNLQATVSLDKFARFTVGDLQFVLKNDGSIIWVKWQGRLAGSITPERGYRETKRYLSEHEQQAALECLLKVERDPLAAARLNGTLTGRCSCCGRPLTDPVSIGFGIGPVCRSRGWGLE